MTDEQAIKLTKGNIKLYPEHFRLVGDYIKIEGVGRNGEKIVGHLYRDGGLYLENTVWAYNLYSVLHNNKYKYLLKFAFDPSPVDTEKFEFTEERYTGGKKTRKCNQKTRKCNQKTKKCRKQKSRRTRRR